MNFREYFGDAKVFEFPDEYYSINARQVFNVGEGLKYANINIVGFGWFELFANGKRVGDELFVPLNTEYHKRKIIIREKEFAEVFATRTIVEQYDLMPYLTGGKNVLGIMLGNGWYADRNQKKFGRKKVFFKLTLGYENGEEIVVSDDSLRYCEGFIKDSVLTRGENQDFTGYRDDWMTADDVCTKTPDVCTLPETTYMTSDCPRDSVIKTYSPTLINETAGVKTYDTGVNTTGRVVLCLKGKAGDIVTLMHAEEKNEDNTIDEDSCCWRQISTFVCDGKKREVTTAFTWNGFRYFSVEGPAEVVRFERIHTDAEVTSDFKSDNKVLNWLYNAFINTQLSNMHSGIPSDCPHLERRGYTGDGQLACNAVMTTIETEKFYRKWLGDIADCQDRITGHVQYTAPYVQSGGGPGGWGGAIVHVPFEFYRHYGNADFFREMLPQMLHYFDFLDNHSENNLITSDIPDEWCLGDWCTAHKIEIPEPFVNNYFYIKCINEILSMKDVIGLSDDIRDKLLSKKEILIKAVNDKYFDEATGDYCGGIQGANAFAVDLGLGDERTYKNLVKFYDDLGMYDTGIFGTDIMTRLLFEKGDGALAYRLLSSEGEFSFGHIMNEDATSLWEYWYGKRSHSHPMFGAVVAYLFEYLLGIKTGTEKLVISPVYPGKDEHFCGKTKSINGTTVVEIVYSGSNAEFTVSVEKETEFVFGELTKTLAPGKHVFSATI